MLFSVRCGWHETYFRVDARDERAAVERVVRFYIGRGMALVQSTPSSSVPSRSWTRCRSRPSPSCCPSSSRTLFYYLP